MGTNRLVALSTTLLLALMVTAPAVLGQDRPQPPTKLEKAPAPTPERTTPTLKACADLVPGLRVTKTLVGSEGRITLIATVCNRGAGEYTAPPGQAVAYFWKDFRTPPLSIGQTGIPSVSEGQQTLPTLAPGKCTTIQRTDTLIGVAAWGVGPPEGKQTLAEVIYTVRLGRGDAIQSDLNRGEDCNPQNNRASQTVPYVRTPMIRIPRL